MQKSVSNRCKEVNQPGFLSIGRKVVGPQSCHMGTNAIPCKTHNVVQHVFTCRRKGKSVLCQRLTKNTESVSPKKSVCHSPGWQMKCFNIDDKRATVK